MCVEALVDTWWDGWSGFNRREVESDLESVRRFSRWARGKAGVTEISLPVACKMAARIQTRYLFLGFQRARTETRLREEGPREFDEWWGKI